MQVHLPETIDWVRTRAEQEGLQTYHLGQFSVSYAVMSIPEEQRPFSHAVLAGFPALDANAKESGAQTGSIIVSDDVPTELRGLWALHEYIDFGKLGHDQPGRCLASDTIITSELITNDESGLLDAYTAHRVGFYYDLAKYMRENQQHGYTMRDIRGCFTAAKHNFAIQEEYFGRSGDCEDQ